jgi:hypothetical protein
MYENVLSICRFGAHSARSANPFENSYRIEIWFPVELGDSLGDAVRMALLFVGMLKKVFGDSQRVDSLGSIVMALISQDTDNLRGQGLVEDLDDGLPVALVTIRDGTIFNVFSSPLAD